jgi:hypothetical protein
MMWKQDINLGRFFICFAYCVPAAGQDTPPATADAVNSLSRSYQRPEFRLGGSAQGSVSGGEESPQAQRAADGQKAGRQRRTGTEVRGQGRGQILQVTLTLIAGWGRGRNG